MLPILGKPITERVMEQMLPHGFDEYILVCDPDDGEFQDYFSQHSKFDSHVRLVYQRESLGTAHALMCAAEHIEADFILSACDNLTSMAFIKKMLSAWYRRPNLNALLATKPVESERLDQIGVVEMEGPWVKRIVEKPGPSQASYNISSLPLYIFSPRIFEYLSKVQISKRGEYELPDAIQMLVDLDGSVMGIRTEERLTLTIPQDLITINRYYLSEENPHENLAALTGDNTKIIPPILIESGARIGDHCILGPNVYIENNCHLGDHIYLRDSVVLRNSSIADGVTLTDQVVYENRS